jgi:hypothetical protein
MEVLTMTDTSLTAVLIQGPDHGNEKFLTIINTIIDTLDIIHLPDILF